MGRSPSIARNLTRLCSSTPQKTPKSPYFSRTYLGVILSICSKNRGETGGNTPLISPITDQNQLRSTKQKLAVVKKMPKLENEYGNHYTRPPDPMQHENQVIMSIGHGVLREIIDILLGSHKELVRPPDQSARFLLVFRDFVLSLYSGEHRTHAETAMVEACLWSKWREAFAAAAGYELNGKESFVCYILRHVRGLEMIEQAYPGPYQVVLEPLEGQSLALIPLGTALDRLSSP
ncbi:hypothetical protein F2Q69_00006060 [Brassica cretica]|uniref:Uncharacterized protein n=1 Tax=Brassica cretica TaxID=69181 RepID=A0A8S9P7Q9_BRACR|nr:hypothetical protein F2Q69_00006060 [Brassica cretica]